MEVATAYQANGTPSGCLISGDGRIASELALGAEALLQLIEGKNRLQTPGAEPPTGGSPSGNGHERADRFRKHSLARSKIKRDGLKAGTPAPDFSLPRLDGRGELTLANLRGRQVLLVFSSPSCGPCLALVSELEKFYREHLEIALVMISKGEPGENRAKVKEHDLTFPIVLQQQWEISRRYAMFGTPVGYLLDEQGLILHDAAVGTDAIRELMLRAAEGARPRLELAAG
jgi:peroxiredoxin